MTSENPDKDVSRRRRRVLGATASLITGGAIIGAATGRGPPDNANANGKANANADAAQNNQPARVTIPEQESDGNFVIVNQAFFPEDGYMSIHDARTRLLGEGDEVQRVLESLIGISPLLQAGNYTQIPVQLFNRFAPATDQFNREGPLAVSQPVIAIPHENRTGPVFELRRADDGEGFFGDVAFTENVVTTLDDIAAANDIATVIIDGADQDEVDLARGFEQEIRESFGGEE